MSKRKLSGAFAVLPAGSIVTPPTTPPKKRSRTMSTPMDTSSAFSGTSSTGSVPVMSRKRRSSGKLKGRRLNKRQRLEVQTIMARRSELKYILTNSSSTAISSTATVTQIGVVAQGATDQDRTGDRLMWCGNIEFKCNAINGIGATADEYNNIRCIIFQWHPNTTPTAATVLLNGVTGAPDVSSHYSHDLRQQFTILFDQNFRLTGLNGAPAAGMAMSTWLQAGVMTYTISIRRAQKQAQYAGGTTGGTNQFYILLVSDSQLATHPTFYYSAKLFYRDS